MTPSLKNRMISSQRGVTSIEYALLAVLIAVVIVGALTSTGTANGSIWSDWTQKVIDAIV
jgi:Flp pilus assembly pilin Flp